MKTPTIKQAREVLRPLGISISKTDFNEFRVNFSGGKEATAYYASDIPDAIDTGKDMARRRDKQELEDAARMDFEDSDEAQAHPGNPANYGFGEHS